MARLIPKVRAPYEAALGERLAVSESLLYRRGNFNGTFDEVILDALLKRADAEVAFSPGFRWGDHAGAGAGDHARGRLRHTALTYANTWTRAMTGAEIVRLMEDVADNLFHPDPYYRQGGDMVRVGGLTYAIDPASRSAAGSATSAWAVARSTPPGATGRRAGPRSPRPTAPRPGTSSPAICAPSGESGTTPALGCASSRRGSEHVEENARRKLVLGVAPRR